MVVSVSKGICQWNRDRKRTARERPFSGDREGTERRMSIGSAAPSEGSHSGAKKAPEPEREATNFTITTQTKNYFKNVSENKEVAKLVGLLSTSINSTKKVRNLLLVMNYYAGLTRENPSSGFPTTILYNQYAQQQSRARM